MGQQNDRYAELHAHSAYTFLEGTDHPAELISQAKKLGLTALGILDVDGLYSAVQTAQAAKQQNFPSVYGAELTITGISGQNEWGKTNLENGKGLPPGSAAQSLRLPVLAVSQQGYHDLSAAISSHNLAQNGERNVPWGVEDLASFHRGNWKILTGTGHGPLRRALAENGPGGAAAVLGRLKDLFGQDHVVVESSLHYGSSPRLAIELAGLAAKERLPLVATSAARCGTPDKQFLADVMAASRLNLSLANARPHLPPFGSFLRSAAEMNQIHRAYPQAVGAAAEMAEECIFDLTLMRPELPRSSIPTGHTQNTWLRELTYRGARWRYGKKENNPNAWKIIDHELGIITNRDFAGYFLIVKDIIDFCRRENILAQGRGSAANSAVCYSLGITAVDAVRHRLLFERFLSPQRSEPPDIDIDIEAARREEVIQYVYEKYGRRRAALVANTITYRPRSAVRAAGKALGYSEEIVGTWAKQLGRGWNYGKLGNKEQERGKRVPQLVEKVAASLQRLPQHMGIHPGGMVLTRTPVAEICPVMWAAKENRTVLQWDKEDCADAGLVKFDLLGLGMLTALRKSFNWLEELGVQGEDGKALDLYNLPAEDPKVYDLLCAAETVGVFQVESRAQMSTLPRLKPRTFYDLVIEVALIRPGPIQGKAVNPYLRRRAGREPPTCHPLLAPILERTLGVPLFQEQLMRIAVVGAGFTPAEADELRRALGSKRHEEKMAELKPRLYRGMTEKGLPPQVQDDIYASLRGFADFGFPESHAFSFAYLVYASAWLKVYYPEHFYAAILASQPMGFYSPASLLTDAARLGVKYRGPSVVASQEQACVENISTQNGVAEEKLATKNPVPTSLIRAHPEWQIRLGLESIKGLSNQTILRILTVREEKPFAGFEDFARRTHVTEKEIEILAQAEAFADLNISSQHALWYASTVANPNGWQPFLPGTEIGTELPDLPPRTLADTLESQYQVLGLSLGHHPLALLREQLREQAVLTTAQLPKEDSGRVVQVAGMVTHRQRPGTAKGVTFLSLEDETGLVNVVCSPGFWTRNVSTLMTAGALIVKGRLEKKDGAFSVRAQKVLPLETGVQASSRDFH